MREKICVLTGAVGGALAALLGGVDAALVTLFIFMGVDFVSGLVVAGVFHASDKSPGGALESHAGFKGLCRKGMTVLFVLVAHRLDMALGVQYVRPAVTVGFLANELISIVENAGLMGLPLPAAVTNAVEALRRKAGEESGTNG